MFVLHPSLKCDVLQHPSFSPSPSRNQSLNYQAQLKQSFHLPIASLLICRLFRAMELNIAYKSLVASYRCCARCLHPNLTLSIIRKTSERRSVREEAISKSTARYIQVNRVASRSTTSLVLLSLYLMLLWANTSLHRHSLASFRHVSKVSGHLLNSSPGPIMLIWYDLQDRFRCSS